MSKVAHLRVQAATRLQSLIAAAFPACSDPACPRWRGRIPWRTSGHCLQGSWYCTPECFEKAVARCYSNLRSSVTSEKRAVHRVPLGLILLANGSISSSQLQDALAQQRKSQSRVGELLAGMGAAGEPEVTAALAQQWRCPIYPFAGGTELRWAHMIPAPILETFRMMPMYYIDLTRVLHIAFCDGVDHSILYRVEQMLDCRCKPCLLPCSVMQRFLESVRQGSRNREFVFQHVSDAAELARITRSYAVKLDAREVRLVSCGTQTWARLAGANQPTNLVFSGGAVSGRHGGEVGPASSRAG